MQPPSDELAPDTDLIRRTLSGDMNAFGILIARYERSMFIVSRCILRDRQLAEDATQDAFLAAFRALPTLKNAAAFGAWLAMIVRRRSQELSRARPRLVPLRNDLPEPRAPALDFAPDRLLAALLQLPETEHQALLLRHFENLDFAAIARITGESTSTVSKRISRGHARLRELLKEYQS
jgi:RNA polymerase sigma-70 factor, ECF subfamily